MTSRAWAGSVAAGTCLLALAFPQPALGQTVNPRQWPLDTQHFDAAKVWRVSRGTGITVAVVDSGVDAHHPDLVGRVLPGADFTGHAANGQVDVSRDSHGTSVAGVIASAGRAGQAVFGLAPEARILPIRISDDDAVRPVALAQGVLYAANHGASVINISVGSPVPDPELRAAITFALDHDIVVVAAAGNEHGAGNPANYPAAFPGVVAVAGTDRAGGVWPRSESGSWITLAAPAEDIYSTDDHGGYLTASGTSYAAPYVSAAVALIRAKYPTETAGQVITRLTHTARRPMSGHRRRDRLSDRLGYGVLDPYRALTAPAPITIANPLLATAVHPHAQEPRPDRSTGGAVLAVLLAAGAALTVTAAAVVLLVRRRRRKPPGPANTRTHPRGGRYAAGHPDQLKRVTRSSASSQRRR